MSFTIKGKSATLSLRKTGTKVWYKLLFSGKINFDVSKEEIFLAPYSLLEAAVAFPAMAQAKIIARRTLREMNISSRKSRTIRVAKFSRIGSRRVCYQCLMADFLIAQMRAKESETITQHWRKKTRNLPLHPHGLSVALTLIYVTVSARERFYYA